MCLSETHGKFIYIASRNSLNKRMLQQQILIRPLDLFSNVNA
jgi:hypothetical protein